MWDRRPTTYEEFVNPKTPFPASRLYHENSKWNTTARDEFLEHLADYLEDPTLQNVSADGGKRYPGHQEITLPQGRWWQMGGRLRRVLRSRRTRRDGFSAKSVTCRQWGGLLEMACGITGQLDDPRDPRWSVALRAWPSGGALYPIETYLVLLRGKWPSAVYHYAPHDHLLERVCDNPPEPWSNAVMAEGMWANACGLVVLTGVAMRTLCKYGERGYRFVLMESGHIAQNLLLAGHDLNLSLLPIGGFDDDAVAARLGVDPRVEWPLYVIMVGRPPRTRSRK